MKVMSVGMSGFESEGVVVMCKEYTDVDFSVQGCTRLAA